MWNRFQPAFRGGSLIYISLQLFLCLVNADEILSPLRYFLTFIDDDDDDDDDVFK